MSLADDLAGKVILITGGASVIGEAIAGAIGARIAVVDQNLEAAVALAGEIGDARGYDADVTSLEDMQRVCAQVCDHGRLDAAVNNAGIGGNWGAIDVCSLTNWERTISQPADGEQAVGSTM